MALIQANATVGTTPTRLLTLPNGIGYITVTIYNGSAANIFLGSASVATTGGSRGVVVSAAGTATICMTAGDSLYGIAASATNAGDIAILYSGI